MNRSETQKIEKLNKMISVSSHIIFLGGAGVSTESGIPDFRGRHDLSRRHGHKRRKPEYYLSHQCLKKEPEKFFNYYRKHLDVRSARPTPAHKKLAELEFCGKLDGIITQNIDGLHQKAGSTHVQEIHGTIYQNHCSSCGQTYSADYVFDSKTLIPRCTTCGKVVRPDIILYGKYLPDAALQNALNMIHVADCLIIGGTSLEVKTAAQLYHGKYLVIINRTKTKMEGMADLVFHEAIGEVLERIVIS